MGFCADGYCCSTACNRACDACAAALKQSGTASGTCGPTKVGVSGSPVCAGDVVCNGTSTSCLASCVNDSACPGGMYCSGTACAAKKAQGASCSAGGNECLTGNCVDGVCCDTACGGACEACSASLKQSTNLSGTCGSAKSGTIGSPVCSGAALCDGASATCPSGCVNDGSCAIGQYCSSAGTCLTKKAQGVMCNLVADCKETGLCDECVTGNCVDSVCCNTACTGLCQACAKLLKTAGNDGECGNAKASIDPHDQCGAEGKNGCGLNGSCNGSGACDTWASTSETCGSNVCSIDRLQSQGQKCTAANTCSASGGTTCGKYLCVPASGQCGASCGNDADCLTGYYCDGLSQCAAKLSVSSACTASNQCATGFCADGFCCSSGCTGACDSCAASLKQSGTANGTCGPTKTGESGSPVCFGAVVCDGISTSCLASCASDSGCPGGMFCTSGGTCAAQKTQGVACDLTNHCKTAGVCGECASGHCVDGVCCDGACGGACQACTATLKQAGTLDGTCGPAKSGTTGSPVCSGGALCDGAIASCPSGCANDASCPTGTYCSTSGACLTKKAQGDVCDLASDCKVAGGCEACVTGNCVDGVCCNSGCTGLCQACAKSLKTAGNNGECGSAKASTDPHDQCGPEAPGTCGQNGFCNGSGACDTWVVGTSCGNATCVANESRPQHCTGPRVCGTVSGTDCGAYQCNPTSGTCPGICATDSECTAGNFCNGSQCVPKLVAGSICIAANQCDKGFCVDGVCCDSACTGICQACAVSLKTTGASGVCGSAKDATDPHDQCELQTKSDCGQNGQCDGSGACAYWPVGTTCAGPVCEANESRPRVCTGPMVCAASAGTNCGAYACLGATGACATACASDTECSNNHFCDGSHCVSELAVGSACTAGSQCSNKLCVDGFCCDTTCQGPCEACSALKKGSGTDGACGPVFSKTDPDNDCEASDPSKCGTNGWCDGSGACAYYSSGAACGATTCTGSEQIGKACNGFGLCQDGQTTQCDPYFCSGNACSATCLQDADCISSYWCRMSDSSCQPDQINGKSCASADECKSGYCIDGYCCDTACEGICQACSASKKGQGSDGACGAIDTHLDPDNECTDKGAPSCQENGTCDGSGACALYPSGWACGDSSCTNGVQVGPVCNGAGTCSSGQLQANCTPYACSGSVCAPQCNADSDCIASSYCLLSDHTCRPDQGNGNGCTSAGQCSAGNCVDGVCCETACTGTCQACSAAKKGSGNDGECGPVGAGTDPNGSCEQDISQPCGRDGSCNGLGDCRYYAQGVSCGVSACNGNVAQGMICNGMGSCLADPAGKDCAPYVCGGLGCPANCATSANCQTGYYCDQGTCKPAGVAGAACKAPTECETGTCVDGVCCDKSCAGTCEACDLPGKEGVCSAVTGDPHGNRPACGGQGDCASICDGTNPATCTYPGSAVVCGSNCVNGALSVSTCDGTGQCAAGPAATCLPYVCETASACRTDCTTNQDCQGGAVCNSEKKCAGAEAPDGAAGAGGSGGSSGTGGSSGSGGTGGTQAQDSGAEAPAAQPLSSDTSGCGCRVEGGASRAWGAMALAFLALVVARGRRAEGVSPN